MVARQDLSAHAHDGMRFSIAELSKFCFPAIHPLTISDSVLNIHRKYIKIFQQETTDADPFKVLWVDPNSIVLKGCSAKSSAFGYVWTDGPLYDSTSNVDTEIRLKSIINKYDNRLEWQDTEYYKRWVQRINHPDLKSWLSYTKKKDVLQHLQRIDELRDSIHSTGFQTQRELLKENPIETIKRNNEAICPLLNEIGVNVDSDGQIAFSNSGLHRLAIAKQLEVDAVPIQIRTRHEEWQKVRNSVREGYQLEINSTLELHPDLRDIR